MSLILPSLSSFFHCCFHFSDYDFDDTQVNTYTIDDMDLYNIPDALFEDLAREFEPLEKGVSPITQVQGNMVCNEMHIVCAFDSDKV